MNELLNGTEQYYLRRVQLANWGTFSGIHDVDVSEKGHLFVGGSGSGKSTVLDAISVLLTPGRINFNAAARPGEKRSDRNFMSYVRGAWSSEQDSDGRAATKFLRTGSTWSAVALTYRSNLDSTVTLLFIAYVRGAARDEASVKRQYFVIPDRFDLVSINDFAASDFKLELIRKRAPSAQSFPSFASYFECMGRYFGITDENVLRLLHKAQSAKNMGDMNAFFRDFMLEVPKTYEIASTLVEEFHELNQAYETVKKTREQVQILEEALKADEKRTALIVRSQKMRSLQSQVEMWGNVRLTRFLGESIPKVAGRLQTERSKLEDANASEAETNRKLERLREERWAKGGDVIERLEAEKTRTAADFARVKRHRELFEKDLAILDRAMPADRGAFAAMLAELTDERKHLDEERVRREDERLEIGVRKAETESDFRRLVDEIDSMRRQPSNIPSKLLQLRNSLAEGLKIPSAELPFAGELMQIAPDESEWQGACERVLHQFALSVLVPERHYARFARAVNDRFLGDRLVYNRMVRRQDVRAWHDDSVPSKFEIKEGPFSDWMHDELAARFDYVCVDSTAEFGRWEKAVTISGQVKHTASRHEKDDRFKVGDKKRWVTGFSNTEKRLAFEAEAAQKAEQIADLQKKIDAFSEQKRRLDARIEAIGKILPVSWDDVDSPSLAQTLRNIEAELAERSRNNTVLKDLTDRIEAEQKALEAVKGRVHEGICAVDRLEAKLEQLTARRTEADNALAGCTVDEAVVIELDKVDAQRAKAPLTEDNLLKRRNDLDKYLDKESHEALTASIEVKAKEESLFKDFKVRWPVEASDMDPTVESASDFFARLETLREDGLPKYEARFRDLLENHTKQNLVDLRREIEEERIQIKRRMQEVNDSLAEVAFNRSPAGETHLRIEVRDNNLAAVAEFKKLQASVISESMEVASQKTAEKYFARLSDLVHRLDQNNQQDRLWREQVLNVRAHVSFQGVEFDDKGTVVEVYESGAGKSGGQQQKLTMTCLVAALRYQLGGSRAVLPKYAAVVMDEAFDKADSEFTDISMRIFADFGFQPVLATPEKGLYTLEPYMGSFSYVSCRERRISSILSMTTATVQKLLEGDEKQAQAHA